MLTKRQINCVLVPVSFLGLFTAPLLARANVHHNNAANISSPKGFMHIGIGSSYRAGPSGRNFNHPSYVGYRPRVGCRLPSGYYPRYRKHWPGVGDHCYFPDGLHIGYRRNHNFFYFSLPYRQYYYRRPPYDSVQYYNQYYYDSPQYAVPDVAESEDIKVSQYLEKIADAFVVGDYAKAESRAKDAVRAEPDNAVLRFVYSQCLFANAGYSNAARLLRTALEKTDISKQQEVFYPLGFYSDQDALNEQIEKLSQAVQAEPSKADLQLLLGYQLLGVGTFDEALDALQIAKQDQVNKKAASMLIRILEKTRRSYDKDSD